MVVGQGPRGIGLEVVRRPIEILVQLFIRGLIGSKRERAVGRVLQTLLQTGVAGERDSPGIVRTKRETVPIAPVQGQLQRVVQVPELRGVLIDVAQAAIWS